MPLHTRPLIVSAWLVVAVACGGGRVGSSPSPEASAEAGTRVTLTTPDGVELEGRLFGTGKVGVTLAHMYPADATSWYPTARKLGELGYAALAFNFRGHDGSKGSKDAAKAPVDLRAAYDFLRARGANTVALVGASMGATASIVLASQVPTPAIVAISAPIMFQGLDARAVAEKVSAPTLLLAARGDGPATQSLRELSSLMPNREPKLFDGDSHGTNLLASRPEATEELTDFLLKHAPSGAAPTATP